MLSERELTDLLFQLKSDAHPLTKRRLAMNLCRHYLEKNALSFGIWLKFENNEFMSFKKCKFLSSNNLEYEFGLGPYVLSEKSCLRSTRFNLETLSFNINVRYYGICFDNDGIRIGKLKKQI